MSVKTIDGINSFEDWCESVQYRNFISIISEQLLQGHAVYEHQQWGYQKLEMYELLECFSKCGVGQNKELNDAIEAWEEFSMEAIEAALAGKVPDTEKLHARVLYYAVQLAVQMAEPYYNYIQQKIDSGNMEEEHNESF